MNVKNFKFRDVQVISRLVTKLGLQKEDINEIVNVLTGAQQTMLASETEVEKYLINNVDAKDRRELYEEHEGNFEKIREYALKHKGVSTGASLFDVILRLVSILSEKFDLFVEFMDYYLLDFSQEQILDFDEDESVQAIMAVVSNKGFAKFFSNMFNLR